MTSKLIKPDPETYITTVGEIEVQITVLRRNADALWAFGKRDEARQARESARAFEQLLCRKGVHRVVDGRCTRCKEMA